MTMTEPKKRGRPPHSAEGAGQNVHLAFPPALLAVVDAEAKDQGLSRNALLIHATRHYLMDRHDTLATHDAWVTQETGEPPPLDMERIALYRAAGLVS